LLNYNDKLGRPSPVGSYPAGASPYGALDVAGNVWEWTSSLYKAYPYKPDDGREDPAEEGVRVLRGGAYYSEASAVGCGARFGRVPPDVRDDGYGFRLVASPPPLASD
jgi:formylglycine-generating enzyme required for sulfatase activity